ncbi:MAG: hypothetical protein IRY99_18405 [Isosphaeraceae bacterium]|nr:hypothetical protein [Isosphaeraceae bacterium]
MSVITRPQRSSKSIDRSFEKESPVPSPILRREPEAPDRGRFPREALEGRLKLAEAPDAGEGRMSYLEHEFTHGRSQS